MNESASIEVLYIYNARRVSSYLGLRASSLACSAFFAFNFRTNASRGRERGGKRRCGALPLRRHRRPESVQACTYTCVCVCVCVCMNVCIYVNACARGRGMAVYIVCIEARAGGSDNYRTCARES